MSFKTFIKMLFIKSSLDKNQGRKHYDENYSELYKLDENADKSLQNSYYFSGHSSTGQSLVFRLGERNQSNSEIWFAYSDGIGNDYICAHQNAEHDQTMIDVSCVEPGKKWKIQFTGGITPGTKTPLNIWSNPKGIRIIPTVFDGEFTATQKIFDYSKDMDTRPIARALAQEKSSKPILEEISNNNQVYYEQSGILKGVLNLSGKKIEIDMPVIRNRSFGKRDWNNMDRHIHICALTNNQTVNINMVGYSSIKELQAGYIINNNKVVCLDSCTSMEEISTDGKISSKFEFLAKFMGGKKLVIKCEKQSVFEFPFDNGIYTIYEGTAKFDINGTKARGVIQFGYNSDNSRWIK